MKVIIAHQTVINYDAVGNDIEAMFHLLSTRFDCWVYAYNQFHKGVRYISREDATRILDNPDNLFIYHHSVYWKEGEALLSGARARKIIRYHNITPESFFERYNEHHFRQCALGREQTVRLAISETDALWLVDSRYNAQDIPMVTDSRISICPPFNKIDQWSSERPDEGILKSLIQSPEINLLFVGRVVPNKGHKFLIETLRLYCSNYDSKIILRIIGRFDESIEKYNHELLSMITDYGLKNNVEFIGEINDSTLMSYYMGSDIFVCASEHEGYCVPIPEAQFFQLPIIARACAAVPDTLGGGQVLLGENPAEYAAAIHILMGKREYRRYLRKKGLVNYQSYCSTEHIATMFKDCLSNEMGINL